MSSRYACTSNNDGNAAVASSNRGMNSAEAPLPTYEQVVGISDPPHVRLGFKNDVPLSTSSSTDQGHSSIGAPNRDSQGARRPTATSSFFTCKPNRTGAILFLIGIMLIPLCGMIVILQMKSCATDHAQLQQSVDKINASYSDCMDDLTDARGNLDSNEILIRDLRYQVEQLTKQRDTFKSMVYDSTSKAKAASNVE